MRLHSNVRIGAIIRANLLTGRDDIMMSTGWVPVLVLETPGTTASYSRFCTSSVAIEPLINAARVVPLEH